jgi:hypothetical protein
MPHSRSSLSVSGEKQSSEYWTGFEVSIPAAGRFLSLCRSPIKRATGCLSRYNSTSLPDSTSAISLDRCVLASWMVALITEEVRCETHLSQGLANVLYCLGEPSGYRS